MATKTPRVSKLWLTLIILTTTITIISADTHHYGFLAISIILQTIAIIGGLSWTPKSE